MKFAIALLFFVALIGCSFNLHIPPEESFIPAADRLPNSEVHWIVTEDTTAECKARWPKTMGQYFFIPACAGWDRAARKCVIVTGTPTTHQILGHEARHCFEGDFHKSGGSNEK